MQEILFHESVFRCVDCNILAIFAHAGLNV